MPQSPYVLTSWRAQRLLADVQQQLPVSLVLQITTISSDTALCRYMFVLCLFAPLPLAQFPFSTFDAEAYPHPQNLALPPPRYVSRHFVKNSSTHTFNQPLYWLNFTK